MPIWLRYQAKKKRAPGPKRYQATNFEVSQVTVKNVYIAYPFIVHKTSNSQLLSECFCQFGRLKPLLNQFRGM